MVGQHGPAPKEPTCRAVVRSVSASSVMFAQRRVRLPGERVGRMLRFADGSRARVYRETSVGDGASAEPCVLVVAFRLRYVRGVAHRIFEAESLLNTPLFVGFPGFVSKLWCAHDDRGIYRGIYEWDGVVLAQWYASCLWRMLELVSVPGSIRYQLLPGLRRDDVLTDPGRLGKDLTGAEVDTDRSWWRLVATT